jgi:hypothetical protein
MSKNNKTKNVVNIGNDNNGSIKNSQIKSGNYIDKSKTVLKESKPGKFDPEYVMFWANPFNDDAKLYKRLPYVNDRPMLEKYYNALVIPEENQTKPMIFYAYIANRRSKKAFVALNVISEHGCLMSPHLIMHNEALERYQYQIIKFKGVISTYNENKEGQEIKYEIKIVDEYEIEVMSGASTNFTTTPWDLLYDKKPNEFIDPRDMFNKYNSSTTEDKIRTMQQSIDILNDLSWNMFNVPNMIAPLTLSIFLMREDIYNKTIIMKNNTHMNIILTIVTDYIINIKPKTYYHTMCIIYYVVFNYLGYDLNNPDDMTRLFEMAECLGVAGTNAEHYIYNAKENAGGIERIKQCIPSDYRTQPGDIHATAGFQFAKRMYFNC